VGYPSASAQCPTNYGLGLDVTFGNGSNANADVVFTIGSLSYTVHPGENLTVNVPVAEGGTINVVGRVNGNVVYTKSFTRNCPPPPAPKLSATASASCPPAGGSGSGTITLSNTGNASGMLDVSVNGTHTQYTLNAGETRNVPFTIGTSADVTVVVTGSKGNTLYSNTFPKCSSPNHPPHGILYVPVHRYVGSNDKGACVDEVSDLDGDPIKFTFKYVDAFGREVGTMVGGANAVWQQPGGAWCDTWIAPADPTQVTVYVTLDDGHGGVVTYSDNFPVIANQTGN
jgi:hypothetical protein